MRLNKKELEDDTVRLMWSAMLASRWNPDRAGGWGSGTKMKTVRLLSLMEYSSSQNHRGITAGLLLRAVM